ncbi:receptor-like serine threonine-protein kinase [Musa troglodytarum]|uniref:Receptor-like serine threonine-protein kinase n=1 Tax=Musa troglodytarum TaxID=320322 RepID=A0A9E7KEJ3_9LILI|nr:receptor-like serine threonine-protein kinase [Musa troglodytarum]
MAIMQTAAVPVNSSTFQFYWDFVGSGAPDNEFYANLHFSELLPNTSRAFDVYVNGEKWYANYTPPYLMSDAIYSTNPLTPSLRYNWALNSSDLSTLPPILNALEVYTPVFLKNTPTDSDDGSESWYFLDNLFVILCDFLEPINARQVQHLIRIHHKNLVSMVGYCMDGDHLALVYEYMSQGTLLDYIRGKTRNASAFSWGKRLQIAIEAAQGLEYLHKGCKPPLIHRDVKTANILLSEQLEAKIADFGPSKAIQNDVTNVPTAVVGTPGYLDPECMTQASHQRPTMTDIVAELKESLALKCPRDTTLNSISKSNIYAEINEISHDITMEIERFVEFSPLAR